MSFESYRPPLLKPLDPSKGQGVQSFLLPVSRSMVVNNPEFFQPIIFQFVPDIKDGGDSADFESIGDGLGRAEQYKIYKSGKNRVFTLNTTFAAIDDAANTRWVQKQIMRLRSFTKPIYDRDGLFNGTLTNYYAPPLIIFTFGKLWVNIPVVINSIVPTTPDEAQIDQYGLPTVVNVEIQMETNYPYGYVPGYLNYWKIWKHPKPDEAKGENGNWNPKQLSFGGNITTTDTIYGLLQQQGNGFDFSIESQTAQQIGGGGNSTIVEI